MRLWLSASETSTLNAMHLLINTLSIGSMSGQHVVYGFLRPFTRWMKLTHNVTILHYENEKPPQDVIDLGVQTVSLPESFRHWAKRTLWESTKLSSLVKQVKADLILTVSGAMSPNCPFHRSFFVKTHGVTFVRPIVTGRIDGKPNYKESDTDEPTGCGDDDLHLSPSSGSVSSWELRNCRNQVGHCVGGTQ